MAVYILLGVVAAALLLTLFVMMVLRRVVSTNMVHIVQAGKRRITYGRGTNVYYEVPQFIPFFGVTVTKLPINNFDVHLADYPAQDKGRQGFLVDVRAFFVISDADKAAERALSFDDMKRQLTEILRGSVRAVLSQHPLEEILGSRTELATGFTKQVEEQLAEFGVSTVKSIEFMDMRDLPGESVIHDIMSKDRSRIAMESRFAIAENDRQAQTKEIEARREVDTRKQEAALQVGQKTADTEKAVGIARERSKQEVLAQQQTTTEREMAVKQVEEVRSAEIARDVATVKAEQDKKVLLVNAEAARQTAVIAAEAEKSKTVTIAEGQLDAARHDAEGIKARGLAEAEARQAVLLAETAPQITLAKEIGENKSYQEYLISIRGIEANQAVGQANAEALKAADIKVIANGGDVTSGVNSIGDILGSKGGAAVGAFLTSMAATDEGKALVQTVTGANKK